MIDVQTLMQGVSRHGVGAAAPAARPVGVPADWLAATLDELDYGLVVLDPDARVRHLNHAARVVLSRGAHPLVIAGDRLRLRQGLECGALQDALLAARRGLRRLVALGRGEHSAHVVVEPLSDAHGSPCATLIVLGRQQVCESLSVQCYAQLHHLTPAEAGVLRGLCEGLEPVAIARERGVGLATVRTQIGNLRAKTGVSSIRELVLQVSSLPPLRSSLRHGLAEPDADSPAGGRPLPARPSGAPGVAREPADDADLSAAVRRPSAMVHGGLMPA